MARKRAIDGVHSLSAEEQAELVEERSSGPVVMLDDD